MNCIVMDSGRDVVVIDAGIMFPDDGMLGIDYVIPDFTALLERKERIRGLFLTHGHDDHIGAVPFLLQMVNIPVYATELTGELLRIRLKDYAPHLDADIRVIGRDEKVLCNDFSLEAFPVCHSIPEGVGFIVRTKDGTIVHSGDFKIDNTPPDGVRTDLARVHQVSQEGISLLLSDSTNVENKRDTFSEQYVKEALKDVIRSTDGRVVVSMFASNILRLKDTIETAWEEDRMVAVTGMSMVQNLAIAKKLGYLKEEKGRGFVNIEDIDREEDGKLLIMTTGSQGEPLSALSLMSRGQHKFVKAKNGDRVVLSSRFIPGNEKAIYRLIDNLFRMGADVLYQVISDVHVSGHGGKGELITMLKAASPRYFVPIHGEFRHLVQHGQVATATVGAKSHVVENGTVLILENGSLKEGGRVHTSRVYVDGKGVGDVCEMVLRERRNLSREGVVIAVIGSDGDMGKIVYGPEIICVGVTGLENGRDIIQGARDVVLGTIEREGLEHEEVRRNLRRYFNRELKRKPVVFPFIVDM
jgi:ribonuclease J